MDDLLAFIRQQLDARERQLDEDERVAREASRRDEDGWTPSGEHWHWVEPEHDQVLALDPMLDEYLHDGRQVALRSVEEYPTSSSYTLPHFVVSYAEDTRTVDAMHIVRWDPARVLEEVKIGRAEVEAKRRILDDHPYLAINGCCGRCIYGEMKIGGRQGWPCITVRMLAQPYAGREGWHEEWSLGPNLA